MVAHGWVDLPSFVWGYFFSCHQTKANFAFYKFLWFVALACFMEYFHLCNSKTGIRTNKQTNKPRAPGATFLFYHLSKTFGIAYFCELCQSSPAAFAFFPSGQGKRNFFDWPKSTASVFGFMELQLYRMPLDDNKCCKLNRKHTVEFPSHHHHGPGTFLHFWWH